MKIKFKLNESLFVENDDTANEPTIDITKVPNIIGVLSGEINPFDSIRPKNDAGDLDAADSEKVDSDADMRESLMLESRYDDLEDGTCFQFKDHPSIYVMEVIPKGRMTIHNKQTGQDETIEGKLIQFRAFGHPYAYWWMCPYDWLKDMLAGKDISILSEQEITKLISYTDNSKDKFKLPTP